jgi:hypothetical protein
VWRDGTVTLEVNACEYKPHESAQEHDFWVGSLVRLSEPPCGDSRGIGVVQKVNMAERTALVVWHDSETLTLWDEEAEEGHEESIFSIESCEDEISLGGMCVCLCVCVFVEEIEYEKVVSE